MHKGVKRNRPPVKKGRLSIDKWLLRKRLTPNWGKLSVANSLMHQIRRWKWRITYRDDLQYTYTDPRNQGMSTWLYNKEYFGTCGNAERANWWGGSE